MFDTTVSTDGQALLLLCSSLGLPRGVKPLSTAEWNRVASAMAAAGRLRPADLLATPLGSLQTELGLAPDLVERMRMLLDRGGQLALELERLAGRGIWALTRADAEYPSRLKTRLRSGAPPVLFGAGPREEWPTKAIAVVGSRDVDEEGLRFTERLSRTCAAAGIVIVSGGAKGTDSMAQEAALGANGRVVAVLAESLEKTLQKRHVLGPVREGRLTLLSAVHPSTPFAVGLAMARNRLIYCLSDAAVVVASAAGEGGTWTGARENLERSWVPLYVADYPGIHEGNRLLIAKGGRRLSSEDISSSEAIGRLFESTAVSAADSLPPSAPARLPDSRPRTGFLVDAPAATDQPASHSAASQPTMSTPLLGPIDLYVLVVDPLREYCLEPRTAEEIGRAFVLEHSQVKTWLGRAVKDGTLKKLAKPVRYVATRSLFRS